jgi:hypothetical protein
MPTHRPYFVVPHGGPRPDAPCVLFCDGSGGALFREGSDLELSHWRPNRTPPRLMAGTSTEICFRFLDESPGDNLAVAVNNHVDVDGLLSVYVLVRSQHALANRRAIIEAAEMGDFWGWGGPSAQRLFQGLTRLMNGLQAAGAPAQAIYGVAFERVATLLDGTDPDIASIDSELEPLRKGALLVDRGEIRRHLAGDRLACYSVPRQVVGSDLERALAVPAFNEAISTRALLWPHVCARLDAQRVCLVSYEIEWGWFHGLWFPGYLWAETAGLWQVPGLHFQDGMERYDLRNDRLSDAVGRLQQAETSKGRWVLGGSALPAAELLDGAFPLVMRFLDDGGDPAVSPLLPEQVAQELAGAF